MCYNNVLYTLTSNSFFNERSWKGVNSLVSIGTSSINTDILTTSCGVEDRAPHNPLVQHCQPEILTRHMVVCSNYALNTHTYTHTHTQIT